MHVHEWVRTYVGTFVKVFFFLGGGEGYSFITDFVYCYYFIAVVVVVGVNSAYRDKGRKKKLSELSSLNLHATNTSFSGLSLGARGGGTPLGGGGLGLSRSVERRRGRASVLH